MIRPAACVLSLLTCVCVASAADDLLIPPAPFPIQRIELPPAAPPTPGLVQPMPTPLNVEVPPPMVTKPAAPVIVQPYAPATYAAPAYVVPMTPQLPVWTNPPRLQSPVPAGSLHDRYPYYSYRRPWYTPGPASLNATIVW